MEKILIGKVVNAVGIKGELKVYNYSDSDEIYRNTPMIYVGKNLYKIENVRMQKHMVILKLKGIDDRNAAELAKGSEVFITEEDLPELEEGVYYVRDLIGLKVRDQYGNFMGTVSDVIQNTAQDLFEVETQQGRKVLIPKVDQFVTDINIDEGIVSVRLIEGLMDL